MEKYDILLNEIKKYLKRPEVSNENTNNEVISLFDLYNIINGELEELRNITINSKIEKKLCSPLYQFCYWDGDIYYSNIRADEKSCKLIFHHWRPGDELIIYKDRNVDEIYINQDTERFNKKLMSFVKRHYNLILEILTIAEKYTEFECFFSYNFGKSTKFTDDLFKVILSFDQNGEVETNISIIDEHELHEEYDKKWYKRQSICDFANEHKEEILKRISVSPYALDGVFKKIYNKNKEKIIDNQKLKTKRKIWL